MYKVGDRVQIKDLDWYNKNKDKDGKVACGYHTFTEEMSKFCGQTMIVCKRTSIGVMTMGGNVFYWTDEMIEGLAEEETKPKTEFKVGDKVKIKGTDTGGIIDNIIRGQLVINNGSSIMVEWPENVSKIEELVEEKFGTASNPIEKKSNANCLTQERVDETKPKFKIGDKITNGKTQLTILSITSNKYIVEDNFGECGTLYFNSQDGWKIVEEEIKPKFKDEESKKEVVAWMPNGKLVAEKFNDGTIATVIDKFKYNKLPINSEFCDDKVELVISPDFELKKEGDKWFAIKKKKEYPKTYEECIGKLPINWDGKVEGYKCDLLAAFQKLLICRDAYWKLYGEEMRLGKPWEPDWDDDEWPDMYYIGYDGKSIDKENGFPCCNMILIFPTAEMRDAFYESFNDLIEYCKELL